MNVPNTAEPELQEVGGDPLKGSGFDKNEIFRAAHDASAATDFVLSLEREISKAEALEIGNSAATDLEKAQVIRDETETLENDRDLVGSVDRDNSAAATSMASGNGERENTRFVARMERESGTVAVHDKSLGTEQHTPVDTLTIPMAGGRNEESSPRQPLRDGLSASFAAAKSVTAEKLGDIARTFPAQTQSGNYRGEIIGETEFHVVQRLSPQSAIAHMKHFLEPTPKVGDNVGIAYVNDLGSVKELRDRSRARELVR